MGQNIPTTVENIRSGNNQYEVVIQARRFDEIAGIYNVFRNGRDNMIEDMNNENYENERPLAQSRRTVVRGSQRQSRVEKETPKKQASKGFNTRRIRFHTVTQIQKTCNPNVQSYKVFYSDGDWTLMTRNQLKKEHPTEFIDFLLSQRY